MWGRCSFADRHRCPAKPGPTTTPRPWPTETRARPSGSASTPLAGQRTRPRGIVAGSVVVAGGAVVVAGFARAGAGLVLVEVRRAALARELRRLVLVLARGAGRARGRLGRRGRCPGRGGYPRRGETKEDGPGDPDTGRGQPGRRRESRHRGTLVTPPTRRPSRGDRVEESHPS